MIYEYNIGDRTVAVEIERDGDGYRAVIDGRPYRLDTRRIGPGTMSLILEDRSILVHAAKGDGAWHVFVGGETYDLRIPGGAESQAGEADDGPELVDGVLKTPMPGRIVSVEVEEGQEIEAGQTLVVLESMKMQNSIVSPVAGRVVKVHRGPGELASFGDPLVEIAEREAG
jgi:acetyl/propionyl-CoA carboxylase alpha subunit